MNIYFLTRWGNGHDDEGPDSSLETNLIIRAKTLERASESGDPLLNRLPVKTESGRPVASFTQVAVLLGISVDKREEEGVICWPWYGNALPQNCGSVWVRDSLKEGWITHEEYYGESPID